MMTNRCHGSNSRFSPIAMLIASVSTAMMTKLRLATLTVRMALRRKSGVARTRMERVSCQMTMRRSFYRRAVPVARRRPGEDEEQRADRGGGEHRGEAVGPTVTLDQRAQAPPREDAARVAEDSGQP